MAPENRRTSFLSMGGANSLENFALAHQRATAYKELALVDRADVSPCTSAAETPFPDLEAGSEALAPAISSLSASNGPQRDLLQFLFPAVPEPAQTGEDSPLLGKKPRRSSVFSLAPNSGNSTAPQTVLNAVNTLMGIAMLSLLFGLRLSGWVFGVLFFLGAAYTTAATAKILGSILRRHKYCNSYGDIAHLYGGSRFSAFATATFTVDLIGALVSLILLFSDSFFILFPECNATALKGSIVAVTFCLSFLPLYVVLFVSLLGIMCTLGILSVVAICGFSTGTLLHPESTRLWPLSFKDLLFSVGIFMAPWGGHPVFPELYRDMRHPAKFDSCCNYTFLFTTALDSFIAVIGYLMYGHHVSDSLTKNLLLESAYEWVNPVVCVLMGLLPISKLALIVRPLIYVIEDFVRRTGRARNESDRSDRKVLKVLCRFVFMALLFFLSMAFNQFGKVVAFLGSAICCTICITFPLMFHLKLNAHILTPFSKALTQLGIFLGVSAAVFGTYGTIVSDYA